MRNTPFHDVELHVDDLAEFVFIRNVNNVILELSLGGIENNKDLFFFCLDLFCKGLVLMKGNGQSVNLEDISIDDFNVIKAKMQCAGIEPALNVYPADVDASEQSDDHPLNKLNVEELNAMDDNAPMDTFQFRVTNPTTTYVLSFKLIHNIS